MNRHFTNPALRRVQDLLREPWAAPALLLAVAVIVGAGAFAYVSRVNDDVDRKEEAAQILARMQTSTARLGSRPPPTVGRSSSRTRRVRSSTARSPTACTCGISGTTA